MVSINSHPTPNSPLTPLINEEMADTEQRGSPFNLTNLPKLGESELALTQGKS